MPTIAELKTQLKQQNGALTKAGETNANTIKTLNDAVTKIGNEPNRKGINLGQLFGSQQAPHGTSGPLGERPYSYARAFSNFKGWLPDDMAKEEKQIGRKLWEVYHAKGFTHLSAGGYAGQLVPIDSRFLPNETPIEQALHREVKEKMFLDPRKLDPDEVAFVAKRFNVNPEVVQSIKSLGTLVDTAGGTFVNPPVLGEFIDLQRNEEAFTRSGASEIGLPPNGSTIWPKLTGASTAYRVGEAQAFTESQQKTGDLYLQAKKYGVWVKLNNELLRFAALGAEAIVRKDMALQSAQLIDQDMFNGTGGTQILGLLNYQQNTANTQWQQGIDKVQLYTGPGVGVNGNIYAPEDWIRQPALLPDQIEASVWIMRKFLWGFLASRRGDAVTSGDGKGQFVPLSWVEDFVGRRVQAMQGMPVICSNNVPSNQTKGSGTGLTPVITGRFMDWIIARMGVMEIVPNQLAGDAYIYDQTWLRAIQFIDAGPRNLASFCLYNALLFQ